MYNWTIDIGHSSGSAPDQDMSREKFGDTSIKSITPDNALTGQDPERFKASPEVIRRISSMECMRGDARCCPNVLQPKSE